MGQKTLYVINIVSLGRGPVRDNSLMKIKLLIKISCMYLRMYVCPRFGYKICTSSVDFKTFRVKMLYTFREPNLLNSHLSYLFTDSVNFHI